MDLSLLDLPWWGLVLITAVMCHLTVMAVTLYLHRDQTHRGIDLHPALRHLFRFWLWLATGIVTKEWVAIHRKHHAKCETAEDPHSPVIFGIKRLLLEGRELYVIESRKPETLEKYGRGTPDDWLEREVYAKRTYLGVYTMAAIDVLLFGPIGLTVFALQMITIPVLAAGVINGLGHWTGYRTFECKDASRNVVPWGLVAGGEELHNNHHAFPSSAKFALRPFEFDLGWAYIKGLAALGLCRVRRVAPVPQLDAPRATLDLDAVRAVLLNRMHVLRDYTLNVVVPTWRAEAAALADRMLAARRNQRLLTREPSLLDAGEHTALAQMLERSAQLRTVYEFRQRLTALWEAQAASNERLVQEFRDWSREAEATRIEALADFAARLRGYTLEPATA
jgi:stearoyl-CoA desaturase (delta-9 desaturase)